MVAVKKHICPTCGYKLPRTVRTTDSTEADVEDNQAESRTIMPRFWSKLLKWEFGSTDTDAMDTTQEKPVLN
jgi:hypothetical protein